ncbi:MAG: N-acetyltransferase family protein [Myxococcaceae bacterium]
MTAAVQLRPETTPDVEIQPVSSTADREAFLRFPMRLYQDDPNFVPPILAERRDFLDPKRNPFFQHASVQLFLARRGGDVVGRIAAVDDPNWNKFHNSQTGFFGMFDAIDDAGVAAALFDIAAQWVARRGLKTFLGPVNLSTNSDCGLLVEGFDTPPSMMMPYNFPYYTRLFEASGFRKARDLWSYEISSSIAPPEQVVRVADRLRATPGVTVRQLRLKELPEETRRIKSIYHAMLEQTWGFVPLSDDEFDLIAARLKPLVQMCPDLCLIAEVHGEPVAFALTLPDSNVALKAAGGQLTRFGLPVGLARMWWASRKIDRLRMLMLGIKPGYRRRGIDALLAIETLRTARAHGYSGAELGWTTEDNELMNRAIERMGARRYKTYRMYERSL